MKVTSNESGKWEFDTCVMLLSGEILLGLLNRNQIILAMDIGMESFVFM